MKTLRKALNDAANELEKDHAWSIQSDREIDYFSVLEKHIAPFLAQPVDAAAMRKAEVARIAEALFITESAIYAAAPSGMQIQEPHPGWSFDAAESFAAYKESLK
jgi:hypothetical protein